MRPLLFSAVLSLAIVGCAKTPEVVEGSNPAPAEPVVEAPAETAPATSAAVSRTILADDIAWTPFKEDDPDGIQIHILTGNPQEGPFVAVVKIPANHTVGLHVHSANFVGAALTEGFAHWATDGEAEALPIGSAFYQPGGEPHNDACVGTEPCVLLAFFDNKMDSVPAEAVVENPQLRVVRSDAIEWKLFNPKMPNGPQIAMIKGSPAEDLMWSALVKFPAGMETNVHTHSANFAGGLISGPHSRGSGPDSLQAMTPGSVWWEVKNTAHMEKCGEEAPCIFVGTMDGKMDQSAVEIKAPEEAPAPAE